MIARNVLRGNFNETLQWRVASKQRSYHFAVLLDVAKQQNPNSCPLSLTVLGWSHAWHPQGPIHPQPHPVPLHVGEPPRHQVTARRAWEQGWTTCSGTGRQGGAVGLLRVPGLTAPLDVCLP